jgi:hypothetical protein
LLVVLFLPLDFWPLSMFTSHVLRHRGAAAVDDTVQLQALDVENVLET